MSATRAAAADAPLPEARTFAVVRGRGARALVRACLAVSGASALVYEVIWLRALSLVMGHTVYALSAVLTAFFGGLALGSVAGGRLSTSGSPLRRYAAVEAVIAVYALALPWLLAALAPAMGAAYRSVGTSLIAYSLVQFVLVAGVLLPPTVCMGATLPLVTAALVGGRRAEIARDAGWLYGLNSLGGAVGAAAAGFVLLPALGMHGTTLVASAANATVALAALMAYRSEGADPEAVPEPAARRARPRAATREAEPARMPWPVPELGLLLLCYGLSGFAALTLEVGWARIVSLALGSTTYGFTVTLVTYIVGLALGGLALPRLRFVRADAVRAIVLLHVTIALWSLVSLPYLGTLPARVARVLATAGDASAAWLLAAELLLVLASIAVPTVAMGGLFPLVVELVHRRRAAAGVAVGASYAANTVGNILGSFVGGFVLVPWLGMRATVVVSAVLSAAVGTLYLLAAARTAARAPLAWTGAVVAVIAVAAVFAPGWDREIVISAPFFHRVTLGGPWPGDRALADALRQRYGELVDYREGATTAVSVRSARGVLWLQSAGIAEAASYPSTQNFIGQLPLLLHGSARDVLIVGLGSGGTLGSVLTHPVERVDSVEISPEIRDFARKYFSPYTANALDDPRAHLITGDGRNHLRHSGRRYDVIVSQPSLPWLSGSASLFTREYFQEMRDHLAPGGIACAWFWVGGDEIARSILRAWHEVFPRAYVFGWGGAQAVLIGLTDDRPLSAAKVEQAMARPEVRRDLEHLKLVSPADVLGTLFLGPDSVARFASTAPANTDDNGHVEFASGGGLAIRGGDTAAGIARQREDPVTLIDATLATPEATAAFTEALSRIYRQATTAPPSSP